MQRTEFGRLEADFKRFTEGVKMEVASLIAFCFFKFLFCFLNLNLLSVFKKYCKILFMLL